MKNKERSTSAFDIDGIPPMKEALPLSLQHVFSIVASAVTMAIMVGTAAGLNGPDLLLLVQTSLFFSGLATLLQNYPIGKLGSRLPIVFGSAFTFLPVYLSIAGHGIGAILGAQILGGIITFLCGALIEKVRKFFPPVVTGTVVMAIGLSLYPISINYIAGGVGSATYGQPINWILGIITLVIVTICTYFGKGIVKSLGVCIGIVAGYVIALGLNMVDFAPIAGAGWLSLPRVGHFGIEFKAVTIVPAILIFLVNSLQAIGDLSALTVGGLDRDIKDEELSGGLKGLGVMTSISALFGGMAFSSYSANVGMICFNKVVSRFVVALAAGIIVIAGIFPKLSALFLTIPYPVLGGATITIFAMITLTGFKLILEDGLCQRNTFIVAISLAFGMGVTMVPEALAQFPTWIVEIISDAPYVLAALVAFFTNLVLPKTKQKAVEAVASKESEENKQKLVVNEAN